MSVSQRSRKSYVLVVGVSCLMVVGVTPSPAETATTRTGRTVFRPQPLSSDDFAVGPTTVEWVKAPDEADMYVEITRPETGPKGIPVPDEVPVILVMTPYRSGGYRETAPNTHYEDYRTRFVPKGFAYALAHGYGTGSSEGCLDFYGPKDVAATSAVIEYLGTRSWSSGRVGMIGGSYDGGYALHAAARGSVAARDHLAAIVPVEGVVSMYDYFATDGVGTSPGGATQNTAGYAMIAQGPGEERPFGPESEEPLEPEWRPDLAGTASRQAGMCRAESLEATAELERTGNFSAWLDYRSVRPAAPAIRAATLMIEGFHDGNVGLTGALSAVGFFDQIPHATPHALVVGQWGHAQVGTYRADRWAMIQAWLDRYLLDLDTGTEDWPQVQIQDSSGDWRAEIGWPRTRGPVGQLALSQEDQLGAASPSGSTTYLEPAPDAVSTSVDGIDSSIEGDKAAFTTGPLAGPLHIAGLPVVDLWLKLLDQGDAHLAVELHAFDADGIEITSASYAQGLDTDGSATSERLFLGAYRSVQHLDPIRDGEFRQMEAEPAPVGAVLHVPVRFQMPFDLVVPAGGSIRIEVGGMASAEYGPSQPSGSATRVQILHSCGYPSSLRFVMPDAEPEWLDVAMRSPKHRVTGEPTGQPQLFPVHVEPGLRDAGGMASARVCGKKPLDPQKVLEHP